MVLSRLGILCIRMNGVIVTTDGPIARFFMRLPFWFPITIAYVRIGQDYNSFVRVALRLPIIR